MALGHRGADRGSPIQTPSAGPIAAYPLDAGEGTVAEDLAGEHDGTIEGAEWAANGKYGQALKFDGEEDCVSVPDSPELQLDEEFTLEAWVKPEGSPEHDPVLFKETEGFASYSLGLGFQGSGKLEGYIGEEGEEYENVVSPEALQSGVWTHIAFTYDGAHERLYVNGEEVSSHATAVGNMASTGPLLIGCAKDFNEYFGGKIDEPRTYDRALGGGEVGADMAAAIQTPQSDPIAAYPLDTGEGAVAEDPAGGHEGTIEGAEWTNGKYGGALKFKGEEEDCVSVPESPDLQLGEEFTLEAWVKPEGALTSDPIIFKEDEGGYSYVFGLGFNTTGKVEGYAEGEGIVSPSTIETGVWTHLAYTYDGARMRLYVNGKQVASKYVGSTDLTSKGPLDIGCAAAFNEYFNGKIDEPRIYNRALDEGEISADRATPIHTPQAGPVATYPLDEGEGEVAGDPAGEHEGTLEGAEWTNGKYGSALQFSGNEECVNVADAPDLQLREEFTLEAWVKPEGTISHDPVIFKETEGFTSYAFGIGFQGSGKVEGYIGEEGEEYENVVSPEALEANVWTHIAFTFDGAKIRLYVNGQHVATDLAPVGNMPSAGPLWIGCAPDFNEYFEGKIDEVRIYNRALDEGEINADKAAAIQTPQAGPVAAYPLDEGEGSVAGDPAGEHEGTIEGAKWTNGKYGSALEFNGEEEECVTVPDSPDLQLSEEFTLEAWVKPRGGLSNDPIIFKEAENFPSYWMELGFGETGKAEGYIGEDEENYENVVSPKTLEANVWTHLAFTYDGAKMRLYVNGELAETHTAPSSVVLSAGPLWIGCAPAFEEGFRGKIDEVRIYDRTLSEGELRQTMNAGFPIAITEAATEVEANDAILHGTADANGGEAEYFFEYGPTTSYESTVMGEELGSDREAIEISEAVIDLAPETTYHYRLVADNPVGTAYGKDQTFTTPERTMTVGEEEELREADDNMDLIASESKAGPGDFYGMMWTGNYSQMFAKNPTAKEDLFDAVEHSGAKMLRILVRPHDPAIAKAFTEAAERNITLLPYFGAGAYPKPGTGLRENWIKYAETLVEEYGPGGSSGLPSVEAWEIWNEPNMYHGKEAFTAEQEPNVNPKGFAAFFKEMAEAVRSAANGKGTIKILTPGLYGYRNNGPHPEPHQTPEKFLEIMNKRLVELKYPNAYNAISLHPYIFKLGKRDDKHAPKNEPEAKVVAKEIESVITKMHKIEPGVPLWITELGFPVANPGNNGGQPPVKEAIQKILVRASFSILKNHRKHLGIAHAFYYNIQDDSREGWEYHAGLMRLDGTPRPAWTPFSNLAGGKGCPFPPC